MRQRARQRMRHEAAHGVACMQHVRGMQCEAVYASSRCRGRREHGRQRCRGEASPHTKGVCVSWVIGVMDNTACCVRGMHEQSMVCVSVRCRLMRDAVEADGVPCMRG